MPFGACGPEKESKKQALGEAQPLAEPTEGTTADAINAPAPKDHNRPFRRHRVELPLQPAQGRPAAHRGNAETAFPQPTQPADPIAAAPVAEPKSATSRCGRPRPVASPAHERDHVTPTLHAGHPY